MSSVTLYKAKRILRTAGLMALLSRGWHQIKSTSSSYLDLRKKKTFDSLAELLAYASKVGSGVIAPFQVAEEILPLLERIHRLRPQILLEIGTANGGTLFLFTRVAEPTATIISIDLPGGQFGDGYPIWKIPLYRQFPLSSQHLKLLRADSHAPATRATLETLLAGQMLDMLFIDGDHSYEGAKADFELYRHLVRPGGMIVFHDIADHNNEGCAVDRVWAEAKNQYRSEELIADRRQGWAGIGVLYPE